MCLLPMPLSVSASTRRTTRICAIHFPRAMFASPWSRYRYRCIIRPCAGLKLRGPWHQHSPPTRSRRLRSPRPGIGISLDDMDPTDPCASRALIETPHLIDLIRKPKSGHLFHACCLLAPPSKLFSKYISSPTSESAPSSPASAGQSEWMICSPISDRPRLVIISLPKFATGHVQVGCCGTNGGCSKS